MENNEKRRNYVFCSSSFAGRTVYSPGECSLQVFAGRNVQANERKFGQLFYCVRRANGGARRANNTGTLENCFARNF